MDKIRTGIVGLGKMGISHCSIVNANSNAQLISICDNSSIVLDVFKKFNPSIKRYTDYNLMIDNENLDALIVATPTKLHYPIVKKALAKRVHVFCEKPFSLNAREGSELVNMADQSDLINQVGYHNHFIGTFIELKRLLKNDIIGEIVHFLGEAYGPVVTEENTDTWRSEKGEGGGCLYDYASHVINLIQEVVGRPISAKGTLLKNIFSKQVEDAVYTNLILDSGVSGTLSVNWSDETYRKMSTSLTILGKKGKIICDATELKVYLKEENRAERLVSGWTTKYLTDFALPVNFYLRGEEYSAQIDYFFDSIIKPKIESVNNFESGSYTDKVIEMIIENSKI